MGDTLSRATRLRLTAAARFGATPPEFDGKTAVEVHEHHDSDGKCTGHTIVTRESVWDDSARARAIALVEHEEAIDQRTLLPVDVAYDPDAKFVVTDVINRAEQAIETRKRMDQAQAKKDRLADGWDDGLRYVVRPATAEEIAEHQRAQEEAAGGH